MEKKRYKLIGSKEFYRRVFGIIVPVIIQNMVTSFVSLLDNIMVGRVGTEEMSGVAIGNQLMFVFNLGVFGALSGIGIFTAQYFGAEDEEGVKQTIRAKFLVILAFAALCALVFGFGGEPLVTLFLNDTDNPEGVVKTLDAGLTYLHIMCWGLLPFGISQVFATTLKESGETRLPMAASVCAVAVNLCFNYILIFGHFGAPKLGVAGAAIATLISRFVEVFIMAFAVYGRRLRQGGQAAKGLSADRRADMESRSRFSFFDGVFKSFYIDPVLAKNMLVRGLPLFINELLWALAMSGIAQCYSMRGLDAVAAVNITNTIFNLLSQAVFSMGTAISIIVGQYLGAGEFEKAKETDYQLLALAVMAGVVVGIVSALLCPLFPQLYNTTEDVRALARTLLLIDSLYCPLLAYVHAAYFTVRSGGKTMVTFFFDSFYMMVLVYPVAFALSRFTGLSLPWIYLCVRAVDLVKATVGTILVLKGVWIHRIIQ